MNNRISYLLAGGLVGLGISHFLNKDEAQKETIISKIHEEDSELVKPMAQVKKIQMKPSKKAEVVSIEVPPAEEIQRAAIKQTITRGPTEPQKLQLTFDEQLVSELESNWSDLRRQAQIMNEPGGWRVSFVDPGSPFARTGLQSGDFISHQAISELRASAPMNSNLSDRVVRILHQVQ